MVRADNGEVCHFDKPVVQRSHAAHLVAIHTPAVHVGAETAVDLLHNLVDPRQPQAEQILIPALQRLLHHRVVGVGNRAADDIPGRLPAIAALVEHDAHQLGNGEHRVGVIKVDSRQLRQAVECAVLEQVAPDDVLNCCGNQKILLGKTQALSLRVVILRVEDLGDDLRHSVLLHSAQIVARVKGFHVKIRRPCRPQAQLADSAPILAGDTHVIRHGEHLGVILMVDGVVVVVPGLLHMAVKMDFNRFFRRLLQPNLAARQPKVRQLGLPAVHQLLAENSVLIAQRIPHGGIALGGKAV